MREEHLVAVQPELGGVDSGEVEKGGGERIRITDLKVPQKMYSECALILECDHLVTWWTFEADMNAGPIYMLKERGGK